MLLTSRRLAPALAVALLALSTSLASASRRGSSGASPVPQGPRIQRLSCGGYDVVPSGFASGGRASRLSIQRSGRLLETVTDWTVTSVECDDITADGIAELVVRTFSGGAHCCETLRVYALGEKPQRLLLYEANNAMGVEVRDINGDGRRELILGDDTFAYFNDLSYADSPASLPLVACFANGRFEDCTRQFPEMLRERQREFLARLKPPTDEATLKQAEGNGLGAVAIAFLLGEEEQGLQAVKAAVGDERVMSWLSRALPQVRDWAAARGTKLKRQQA